MSEEKGFDIFAFIPSHWGSNIWMGYPQSEPFNSCSVFVHNNQYIRSYGYVFILRFGRFWTSNSEIFMVEKVYNNPPIGTIHHICVICCLNIYISNRLSIILVIFRCDSAPILLLYVLRFLQK